MQQNSEYNNDLKKLANCHANGEFEKLLILADSFIKKYPKVILRTNNETGGNGMHILESNSSKKDIVGALKLLNTRCSKFVRNTKFLTVVV